MLPLAQLPHAQLRDVRGVLTDIDDTLTRDGAIEPVALDALRQLRAHDVPVIAVTGRPAGWSEPFVLQWPIDAIVAENGGVMLRAARGGVRRDFAQPQAEREADAARLRVCSAAVLREVPGARLAADSAGRLTDIAIDHSEFAQLEPAQIEQVLGVMRRHGLNATVSSIHVNGWLGSQTKWSGAEWAVRECLGEAIDPRAWAYIGDSTNDQLMFERLPLSVGVANIARFLPQLVTPPAWVTAGERGAGFAEFVATLLAERRAC